MGKKVTELNINTLVSSFKVHSQLQSKNPNSSVFADT